MDAVPAALHTAAAAAAAFLPYHLPPKDPVLLKPHKPTTNATLHSALSHKLSKSKPPPSSFPLPKPHLLSSSSSASPPAPKPLTPSKSHDKAATGYAVALLDVAHCHQSVHAVNRDVRRLMRLLGPVLADASLDDGAKGEFVEEAVEGGAVVKQLAALVRMLVRKKRVGTVREVMEEFRRIYDELTGARASAERRIGNQLGVLGV